MKKRVSATLAHSVIKYIALAAPLSQQCGARALRRNAWAGNALYGLVAWKTALRQLLLLW